MNDEGLADVEAASPFVLPRLHPGIGAGALHCADRSSDLFWLEPTASADWLERKQSMSDERRRTDVLRVRARKP